MNKELLLELYKRQAKIIYGYLIKSGCNKEEAEDIVHDSFVKAIEHMDGVSVEKLSSWLFKVSINNYKNRLKKKAIANQISIDENTFCENMISDKDVTEEILVNERKGNINKCLSDLKEQYSALLIFKYDLELRYKEIAKLMGISEDMVKTYLYRARNEFREIWRRDYE